ncbi:MAG: protein kinase, partial [Chloroflexi bacterium]|nr:protein kinase [Chloroflexota bacterium]
MIPEKIGRYIIEGELGRGGMAVVYLARDPLVGRKVAVKVLPRQFTFDPQFRARFQREAQVIASLDHPAIVPVYDFGEHEEQPYIVMRFMGGGSLADRLKSQGPLPVVEAGRILQRIGSALDEAHQKGIVHRDLKPGNILFDDRSDAFVGDFGIVKMSEATVQYTGNAIIGTPGYMSPEQARGDHEIDGRSDVYSLGAIAYEMLTGRLPYESDTPMGMVMKHILEPVPNVLEARPDLPPRSAAVVSQAMAKNPDERFQTASGLAKALISATADPTRVPTHDATVIETDLPISGSPLPGTVIESPVAPPRPKTVPPTGRPTPPPVETPQPEPAAKRRGVPGWMWAVGCLGVLVCGGVVISLGGLGALGALLSNATPTSQVQNTPTSEATQVVAGLTPSATSPIDASPTATSPAATSTTAAGPEFPTVLGPVAFGQPVQGNVSSGSQAAWSFVGTPSDLVDITVVPISSGFDLVVDVLDESGASILDGGPVDNSFSTEQILNLAIPAQGTYYVAVEGYADTGGDFELRVDAGGQTTQGAGSQLVASADLPSGEGHNFPFNAANSGSRVTALVTSQDTSLDVVLGIYDDDSDQLIEEVDISFTEEELDFAVPAAGNYYFRVTGFGSSSGRYTITINAPPDITLVLASGDVIDGRFDATGQIDYYYRAEAGETLVISADPEDALDILIEVYDADDLLNT